jgi:DNA-binding GntR family transcriptional regulator
MAEPKRQSRLGSGRRRGAHDVADVIAEQIRDGRLAAGSKLPTYFALAEMHQVSVSTIQRAIALLEARGLARGKRGEGVYVESISKEVEPGRRP